MKFRIMAEELEAWKHVNLCLLDITLYSAQTLGYHVHLLMYSEDLGLHLELFSDL
jgi:hypothetical protein